VTDPSGEQLRRRAPHREQEAIMPKTSSKRTVPEHKLFKTHGGHAQHLCDLVAKRKMDRVATLSKGAKYVCHICGRAAAKAANLCEPVEI
jgi:hypothetical protein